MLPPLASVALAALLLACAMVAAAPVNCYDLPPTPMDGVKSLQANRGQCRGSDLLAPPRRRGHHVEVRVEARQRPPGNRVHADHSACLSQID